MFRNIFFIALAGMVLIFSGSVIAGQAKNAPHNFVEGKITLQESSRVDGKKVYLGDLFKNTGEQADTIVAYSPPPGKRAVFDAKWLYQVARANKLNWRPMNRNDRVVIERSSTIINRDQIAEEILIALADFDIGPDMEIDFSNRTLRMYVPGDSIATVGVEDTIFDPRNLRFSVMLHAPAGDPGAKRMRVTGRLHRTTEVPVPVRRILTGEIIKKQDIKWIKVRSRRLQTDMIVSETDIVGKTPRRGLRAGQPVRSASVRRPVLVEKGSLVTIMLWVPKMTLTAQGKAITSGSEGDIIQIRNTQSKTIIEAEVIGSGRVAVRPPAQLAMN